MVGALLTFALAAGLIWLLVPLTPQPARVPADLSAPGRLVAAESTVNLGHVPFDRLVEARFTVANTGGDVVRLVGAPKVQMLEGC